MISMCIYFCHNWCMNFSFKTMVEREAFLLKPKHQCHLSQWGDCVYGALSWIKRRLLCSSMFVTINGQTLIPKKDGKKSFSYETKLLMSSIPIRRMCLCCPIVKRKQIVTCIHVYPNWQMSFDSKENGGKESLSLNPKYQHHLSQWWESAYGSQSRKKRRLLCVSKFFPIEEQTLILRKMVKRKDFLTKPKYHYHLS